MASPFIFLTWQNGRNCASRVKRATDKSWDIVRTMQATLTSLTVLGKVEGEGKLWHGHVTAVTVAPEYRRLGLARNLMKLLEDISEKVYVDLLEG